MKRTKILCFIMIISMVICLVPCNSLIAKSKNKESSFWIEYIDVGQGDAALIQCDEHYMIIDGGPPAASSTIYSILKRQKIKHLDYMIATHPDSDHIGGLSGALNYATVDMCYSTVLMHDTKTFKNLVKYLNKQNANIAIPRSGDSFKLGSAQVDILGPIYEGADTNNSSIVVKITYGSTSFLFVGDAELEEENSLIDTKVDLSCDVLKIGHHGSKNSTGKGFLEKSNPEYAVISVGSDNTYGHPTADVLERLRESKVNIYRTDMQGDITCVSNGKKLTFKTERRASNEALWIAGGSSKTIEIRDGIVVASDYKIVIPEGTTYVLNTNSYKFHIPMCDSVGDISEKNKVYSYKSAEELIKDGFDPCGRCKPYDNGSVSRNETGKDKDDSKTIEKTYVLNKNTKKFHCSDCSSVSDMSNKNREDVTITREELIGMGYTPCKRCNP